MKRSSYIVKIPNEITLKRYLDSHPYFYDTMKTIPQKSKMKRMELTVDEIANKIENEKWCIFPITAKIETVQSYHKIGMKIVFIEHYYRNFKLDYKEYINIL